MILQPCSQSLKNNAKLTTISLHFIGVNQTCKQVKRIQVDRTSSKKVNVRRLDSALNAGGGKLLKELFKFIGNASALQCICFESLEIPVEALPLLGKSLVASKSRKSTCCLYVVSLSKF